MTVEAWWVQNLMGEAGRLEAQERITVQVQRQSADEPGRAGVSVKSEDRRLSEFPLPEGEFCSIQAFN